MPQNVPTDFRMGYKAKLAMGMSLLFGLYFHIYKFDAGIGGS